MRSVNLASNKQSERADDSKECFKRKSERSASTVHVKSVCYVLYLLYRLLYPFLFCTISPTLLQSLPFQLISVHSFHFLYHCQ
jgi:hypothetical protein